MPIIAMTHEMGSKGSAIGKAVADRLGYEYLRHDIIREAAREYHAVEQKLREAVQEKPGLFEMVRESARRYQIFIAAEVYEEALKDNVVIMGRWSTILLRGVPHAIRVRVLAPLSFRITRIVERDQVSEEAARRRIERYDEGVRYRMRQFYDVEWEDPTFYDLSLNTGRLSFETSVAQVVHLAASPQFRPTADGRAIIQNLALGARVRADLKTHRETSHLEITVHAEEDTAVLSGTVFAAEDRTAAERVAKTAKGVKGVINDLVFAKMPPV
ncbi:MAG: cytidylate kinase family protein [Candidatus Methylomirabilales bacterium]